MIYSVIPARSGSKSIKDKNLSKIGNKSLIEYSIETSLSSKGIGRTIFTTNSPEYLDSISDKDVYKIKRPEELCLDTSTDWDYLNHVVNELSMNKEDLIVLLRPTTPFRNVGTVDDSIQFFIENIRNYDSMRSMHKISEPPAKMFKIVNHLGVPYMNISIEEANLPKDFFPVCYHPNGYCDIIKVFNLLNKNVYGDKIYPLVTDFTIEIDSLQDLEYARYTYDKERN